MYRRIIRGITCGLVDSFFNRSKGKRRNPRRNLNFGNQLSGNRRADVTGYVVQATHSFFWAFAVAGIFLLIGIAG